MQNHTRHPKIDVANAERPAPSYRYYGKVSPEERERTSIKAQIASSSDGNTAVMRLYDPIDSWGGYWGVSAKEFAAALDEIKDVKTIELHINSPGGDTFEGVAIYNALIGHSAEVAVVVDGIAASAASVVAMAGDTITVNTGGSMMIHDAWTFSIGDAADMRSTAAVLDHVSDNVASVYAERAGGEAGAWRAVMVDETWYSAQEAVDAGLATAVGKKSKEDDDATKSSFDLSIFNYAGRSNAPAPRLDINKQSSRANVPNSSTQGQESKHMDLNPELLKSLDLPADASEEQLNSRIQALVKNEAEVKKDDPAPLTEGEPEKSDPAVPPITEDDPEVAETQNKFEPPAGTVLLDEAQHAEIQSMLKEHAEMKASNKAKERDDTIKAAMRDFKFPPSQRKHYETLWDSNPVATKALIDSLAKNSVPGQEIGYGAGEDLESGADDAYPDSWKSSLRGAGKVDA